MQKNTLLVILIIFHFQSFIIRRKKRMANPDLHRDDESIAFPPVKWKTDPFSKFLFMRGQGDQETVANISIAIKVMKSYYVSMPVFPAYGMQLVSAYLVSVRFKEEHIEMWNSLPICYDFLDFTKNIWFEFNTNSIWTEMCYFEYG